MTQTKTIRHTNQTTAGALIGLLGIFSNGVCAAERLSTVSPWNGQGADHASSIQPASAMLQPKLFGNEFKVIYPNAVLANYFSFGQAVAISGDTAVVGVYGAGPPDPQFPTLSTFRGEAFVYVKSGNTWVQQGGTLSSPTPSNRANFGLSVAIEGDTVVVGEPGASKAHVYVRTAGVWNLQQTLTAEGGSSEQYGYTVAISGNTVVVGAPGHSIGSIVAQGAGYVYTRNNGVWSQQAKLVNCVVGQMGCVDGAELNDLLGGSLALEGDTLVLGASNPQTQREKVLVFQRSGETWSKQANLAPGIICVGVDNSDQFGTSLDISGNTVAVGVFADTVNGVDRRGSICVFDRNGSTWSESAQLYMTDGAALDQLGLGVALEGDTLLAGARLDEFTNGSTINQGSVVRFNRAGSIWTQAEKRFASDGQDGDTYGHALAMSGSNVIVGAYNDTYPNLGNFQNTGSAYFYQLQTQSADLQISVDNGVTQLLPNQITSYEILVGNAGPSNALGATFSASIPIALTQVAWTCAVANGAAICPNASGSGNTINQTLDLPASSALRYVVTATVSAAPSAFINTTANITAPIDLPDPNSANNTANDNDPVVTIGVFANGFENGSQPSQFTIHHE